MLANAPDSFPLVERIENHIIIRADDDDQYFLLSLVAAVPATKAKGPAKDRKGSVQVSRGANTYPLAALVLGSYYVETKQPEEALTYLERGLRIQPNNSSLIMEKGAALLSLRRFAEAVALYDAALESDDLALLGKRSRFMRNRGVALIDLDRLDEAEKSLKESIKADPEDKIGIASAERELAYIKGLRAGARPTGIEVKTRRQAEEEASEPKP